jgi:hypothetical protein
MPVCRLGDNLASFQNERRLFLSLWKGDKGVGVLLRSAQNNASWRGIDAESDLVERLYP